MPTCAFDADAPQPSVPGCGAGGGGTNQGAGLELAIDELLVNGKAGSVKTMILISDGQAIDGFDMNWAAEFGAPSMGWRNASQFGEFQSDLAESLDFSIFSVSFNDLPPGAARDAQSRYLKGLVTGFGEFFETPNASDLPAIFKQIAENTPIVIVQ